MANAASVLTRTDEASNARAVALGADPRAASGAESDEVYDVVSVLYHSLKGALAYDQYIGDAQKVGDAELERFFRACRTEEHARARRARELLAERLGEDAAGHVTSASNEDTDGISDGGSVRRDG